MEAQTLVRTSFISSSSLPRTHFSKPLISCFPQFNNSITLNNTKYPRVHTTQSSSSTSSSASPSTSSATVTEKTDTEIKTDENRFDWYSQWFPVMPVCDLDKKVPHGKKVMGIDVVVWWDRNENAWKVFDDMCPHRLAPLSEGRIDQRGRLQCIYHGWCFGGGGNCKYIPQAPADGPPVHTFKKACVGVYPSTVQNDIVWFWPSMDPEYKDILDKKKPPYIPELGDPSYTKQIGNRDFPYGYEVLVENLMDPTHVQYAHYGLVRFPSARSQADREGGEPLDMEIQKLDMNGFTGDQGWSKGEFIAPFVYHFSFNVRSGQENMVDQGNGSTSLAENTKEQSTGVSCLKVVLLFFCIPVSPGNSRLIWSFPRNFAFWINKIVPRWVFHLGQMMIFDSDLNLLHVEERKIMEIGSLNWQKACFIPTKSDAHPVAFRRWLNKYANGTVDWGGKYTGTLPPSPPREILMDRFRSHVVNCSSCHAVYKRLNALEVILQVISVSLIGIVAATKKNSASAATNISVVSIAVVCFVASKWLAHFLYKNFHYQDYNHSHDHTTAFTDLNVHSFWQ